jgi:hypothetical protein
MEKSMSFTTKTQDDQKNFQNLDAIHGIKEVSDEAASVCSGGLEAVTLYDKDFRDDPSGGDAIPINGDTPRLGNFNNRTSSIIIRRGTWKLWPDENFKNSNPYDGRLPIVLGVGSYNAGDLGLLGNNGLSSIEKV